MSVDNIEEESPEPQKSSNMMNLFTKGIKKNYDRTKEEYEKAMAKEAEQKKRRFAEEDTADGQSNQNRFFEEENDDADDDDLNAELDVDQR